MVRLLSRQHGRNRPLHLQGAVKTAVARDWGRTIVAIAPANELWIRAFFAPERNRAIAALAALGAWCGAATQYQ
jgi:hypothetical protein